jgi:DNA-binding beta-propeller fold protein YncE
MLASNIVSIRNGMKIAIAAMLAAAAFSGCSKPAVKTGPVFFPPEPNPPRVQYLMGIADSGDIEEKNSGIALILAGQEESKQIKPIKKPYGVATHKGKIYVCDVGLASIAIIDPAKKTFESFQGDRGAGTTKRPVNLTFDKDDNMYVADTARKEILIFGPTLKFIKAVGREHDIQPIDVIVDGDSIYALDINHSAIKVMSRKTGKLLNTIGAGKDGTPGLAIPISFSLDKSGYIYVTNVGNGNVMKFDRDGHFISSFGKIGDGFGDFSRPKGISTDSEGRIYVVDNALQNVQVFNEAARLLMFFGDPGLPSGSLTLPVGIDVTTDNLEFYQKLAAPGFQVEQLIFVTSQFGHDRVSVYGLGKMTGFDYEIKPEAEAGAKAKPDGK